MEEQKFSLKGVFQKIKEYLTTRQRLITLTLTERAARLIASLFTDVIRVIFALFVVFFFSLALGFYLSELLNSNALGFLLTGTIFLLLILLVSLFGSRIERTVTNLSIRRLLKKWNDADEEKQN